MKKWSDELIELSREYLEYDGVNVKSLNSEFGILNIDYDKKIYTIKLLTSDRIEIFSTVEDILKSGWVVD